MGAETAVAIGSVALSAYANYKQGKAAEEEADRQNSLLKMEREERLRRAELNKAQVFEKGQQAIASQYQNVGKGFWAGSESEVQIRSQMLRDVHAEMKRVEDEALFANLSSVLQGDAANKRAQATKEMGYIKTAGTILGTAADFWRPTKLPGDEIASEQDWANGLDLSTSTSAISSFGKKEATQKSRYSFGNYEYPKMSVQTFSMDKRPTYLTESYSPFASIGKGAKTQYNLIDGVTF